LTTHVLDTAHGKPGRGINIALYRVSPQQRSLLCERVTNADGRCDQPLLEDSAMQTGTYELDFDIGTYFAGLVPDLPQPPFLSIVTLRFSIADASITTCRWSQRRGVIRPIAAVKVVVEGGD
jgi:5-hydroxyisourate hydrolase